MRVARTPSLINRPKWNVFVRTLTLAMLLAFAAPFCSASPYVYVFSAGDLLTQLEAVDPSFATAGYYEFWAQPMLNEFTILEALAPRTIAGSQWLTSAGLEDLAIHAPQGFDQTKSAHFYINDSAALPYVAVVSSSASNLLGYNETPPDSGFPCNGCWSNDHTVEQLLNGTNANFIVVLDSPTSLIGVPVEWKWNSTGIYLTAAGKFDKPAFLDFQLTDVTDTPEPGTFGMLSVPLACALLIARRAKR